MTRTSGIARLSASAVLVLGVVLAARALAGPDPQAQPVADGCTRDRGSIFTKQVPNWAFVGDASSPSAATPPPPPQWAYGIAQSRFDPELAAHPTGIDDPFTHGSYDFIFNLRPDRESSHLLSGTEAEGDGSFSGENEQTGRLHVERETGSFPVWAWPDKGDRLALRGAWVWDCDHSGPTGEHTEIHPFHALLVERNPGGPSPRSPLGEREADVFVTSERTVADTQAECAHLTRGDREAFRACLAQRTGEMDVGGSYRFFLRAPRRPGKRARLAYRVVDRGSRGGVGVRVARSGNGVSIAFDVEAATGTRVVVAKQVFVGWRPMPARALPLHLRLRFRELLVRRAMDPGCPLDRPTCPQARQSIRIGQHTTPPGEWNVYMNAGGIWTSWRPRVVLARDGRRIRSRQAVDFYVARRAQWRLFVQTRECDFGAVGNGLSPSEPLAPCPRTNELGNPIGDDVPGILVNVFRSPRAGLGVHRSDSRLSGSTCPPSNRRGCFALTYAVSLVDDAGRRARASRRGR